MADDDFFDEFEQADAYHIQQSAWELYEGLTSELELDEEAEIPAAFRVAITIAPATGHMTLEGTVQINDEELEFAGPTRLTNDETLTELPTITVEDLDCNILIECISTTGEPLYHETLDDIKVVVFPKTRIIKDPSGSGYMETTMMSGPKQPSRSGIRSDIRILTRGQPLTCTSGTSAGRWTWKITPSPLEFCSAPRFSGYIYVNLWL